MSILYIGPYRQNDYNGLESSIYLKSIQTVCNHKNLQLYARPYYTRSDTSNNRDILYYQDLEYLNNQNDSINTLIQHGFVEHLSINPSYKNIAIPILRNKLSKASGYSIIQRLNYFDHIIVGDDYEKNLLIKSNIKKPIHVIYHDLSDAINDLDILNARYDYGSIGNNKYNFMFIGEYESNIDIIHTILFSFASAFRSRYKQALTVILKGTAQNKKDLEHFLQKILKQLNIVNSIDIRIYFSTLNLKDIFAALNSSDCLLCLNQDDNQKLYSNYIARQNKTCLSYKNIPHSLLPCNSPSHIYDTEDVIKTIDINGLIAGLLKISDSTKINNKKDKKNNEPSIGKTVCEIIL